MCQILASGEVVIAITPLPCPPSPPHPQACGILLITAKRCHLPSLPPSDSMNSHLKYRGRSFVLHTIPPTETIKAIGFRGRKTLVSSPPNTLPEDLQFFGWHPEGVALA
ncbi:MAG: hypothetical protein AAGA75_27925 [Cyanobacteria bacterium P01_E01_bin.6]